MILLASLYDRSIHLAHVSLEEEILLIRKAKERGITIEQVWDERAALYPAGRVPTMQEVAEAIAFLASEESSGISGEAIRVALGSVW